MSTRLKIAAAAWGLVAYGAAGCAQVLGIEDAEPDPQLTVESPCASYCQTVLTACVDDFAVYSNDRTCEGFCAVLPEGTDDQNANTVRCRLKQAMLASDTGEVDFHCPLAGPGGDDTCGSNCEGYCTVLAATCPEELTDTFGDLAGCLEQCPSIPDLGTYNLSQTTGNSIQCRLWHLSAATIDPGSHCSHASGGSPCS
jgi:hypothetical protein